MTTKTITTYSPGGYGLLAAYTELDVTATGGFGGGVYSGHYATIVNAGTLRSTTTIGAQIGVLFTVGGKVVNQAGGYIGSHQYGVFSDTTINLTNDGSIHGDAGSVMANYGGTIVNGGYAAPGASLSGGTLRLGSGPHQNGGTVVNKGTIASFVLIIGAGRVTNGGVEDTGALITGGGGIYVAGGAGTIANFATIEAPGAGSNGVNLGAGGRVTNGTATDTAAKIEGYTGVLMAGGTVTNFGLIEGAGVVNGCYGLVMGSGAGESVTNGSALDRAATIEGYTAVKLLGPAATLANFGTLLGQGAAATRYGAYLGGGGTLTNGGGNDHTALIEGGQGVVTRGPAATVRNFGTILAGAAGGAGVAMSAGSLANGSLNNAAALIDGYETGVSLGGAGAAANFGTIIGAGDGGGFGVSLGGTASLTNGAAGHQGALISGYTGVGAGGTANTVTNFGTIAGAGGTAVNFGNAADTLVVEAGCAFVGQVLGGGGTLDLDSGVGTLSGLFSGGAVTVSGSMAATTFQNFATLEIGAGATFSDKGAVSLAAGQTVNAAGTLTLGGSGKASLVNAGLIETTGAGLLTLAGALVNNGALAADGGTLTVTGAVTGSKGAATIDGGTLNLASGFTQNVTFAGASGVLELAQSQTYSGTIAGFSKSGGTFLDLADIGFVSAGEATFSGTSKSGVLTVTDGTHTAHITLKGNYLSATFIASSDGHGGTTVVDPKAKAAAPVHRLIAAMGGLEAKGTPAGLAPYGEVARHGARILARPAA